MFGALGILSSLRIPVCTELTFPLNGFSVLKKSLAHNCTRSVTRLAILLGTKIFQVRKYGYNRRTIRYVGFPISCVKPGVQSSRCDYFSAGSNPVYNTRHLSNLELFAERDSYCDACPWPRHKKHHVNRRSVVLCRCWRRILYQSIWIGFTHACGTYLYARSLSTGSHEHTGGIPPIVQASTQSYSRETTPPNGCPASQQAWYSGDPAEQSLQLYMSPVCWLAQLHRYGGLVATSSCQRSSFFSVISSSA